MNMNDFKKILRKCFGKNKDDRYHAIAMLLIYTIFLFFVILGIRLSTSFNSYNENLDDDDDSYYRYEEDEIEENISNNNNSNSTENKNNINKYFSFSSNYNFNYTITYNGVSEFFFGKVYNNKQKFSYIKDGNISEYVFLDNEFYKLDGGTYTKTNRPSRFFKYCDINAISKVLENKTPIFDGNVYRYNIENVELEKVFDDIISINNKLTNDISVIVLNNVLKSIEINFDNYITSLEGTNLNLSIHIDFSDIGTTSDFEINAL